MAYREVSVMDIEQVIQRWGKPLWSSINSASNSALSAKESLPYYVIRETRKSPCIVLESGATQALPTNYVPLRTPFSTTAP
jgi:hypothetical protein